MHRACVYIDGVVAVGVVHDSSEVATSNPLQLLAYKYTNREQSYKAVGIWFCIDGFIINGLNDLIEISQTDLWLSIEKKLLWYLVINNIIINIVFYCRVGEWLTFVKLSNFFITVIH